MAAESLTRKNGTTSVLSNLNIHLRDIEPIFLACVRKLKIKGKTDYLIPSENNPKQLEEFTRSSLSALNTKHGTAFIPFLACPDNDAELPYRFNKWRNRRVYRKGP